MPSGESRSLVRAAVSLNQLRHGLELGGKLLDVSILHLGLVEPL